ncbi:hypothetical protein M378DRAFT_18669 [Amanita muscaria Koide BX008]|uniref:Uncharacterized protein n=1 Tax=Amanita muscaria (strain Koide BX008) TaxID=946122 RepID=A0A0C2WEZ8_AMAMK|nr:hypothetical protein M378DRAFT_18669 [Amanita muscaria Koide BX008]
MFEYDHTKLQERLAKLSSGVAVITVGGLIIRSRSILPGGGVALLKASLQLAMSSPGSTGGSTNSPVAPDAKPTASDPLRSTTNHSGRLQEEDLRCQERQEEAKGTRVGRDGYTTSIFFAFDRPQCRLYHLSSQHRAATAMA